jgi:DmsE family decaheme c-type cytochrome
MRHSLLCIGIVCLFLGIRADAQARAASGGAQQSAVLPGANTPGSTTAGYAGSEACATCHADESNSFSTNPHANLVHLHATNGMTCESCHGPGQAHIDSGGDAKKIFSFKTASATVVTDKCLSCHAGVHPNYERSPHAKAGLSCLSCHSVHYAKTPQYLLTAEQPQLCYQCHADQKAQFSMLVHHKVNEGLVKCSDCHDVHGSFQPANLRVTADQNVICTRCHTDIRGPFVYEHAPVKAEGCMACHTPHGSQNARLLNMPNINVLCNQCHSPVAAATVHSMSAGSSELQPCTTCHTFIHGSNMNAAFLR